MRVEMNAGSGSSTPVAPPSAKPKPATPDTSPAKAWADAVVQAKANSPQQNVTAKPGDTLSSIAGSHNDTLPSVEEANPQIYCPNQIDPGQTVHLPKKTPAQVVTGVDNSEIKPIITAMANANLADQSSRALELTHANQAFRSDAQAASAQSWDKVQQTSFNMLMNNNAGAYPERAAAAEVKQLDALEPGNARFAQANKAALAEATQQWTKMGVTYSQLHPIISAYDKVNQISKNGTHDNAELNAAKARLNTEIENSLKQAPNSKAMTDRAANLQIAGPQDPAFQRAVDAANYDLQVAKPAQRVANAYATGMKQGGPLGGSVDAAQAAAQELRAVTQNSGNAYYAGQIIQASQGTIDKITQQMGSLATSAPNGPSLANTLAFNQMYADLSQSAAAANTITFSHSAGGNTVVVGLSSGGKAAADLIANDIAKNVPKDLTLYQSPIYAEAATAAISKGNSAALTLATAAALKQNGKSELAAFMTVGAARGLDGYNGLASKIQSDVKAFAATTENVNKLRAAWGPLMTQGGLVKATNGYLSDHPDVVQKANAQLATISQDGDAIAEAEAAWHSYATQLDGVEGKGELSSAVNSLTGNASMAFATSQSKTVDNAIAAAIGPSMPSRGSGGSVVQALLASPAWSLPKSTRSFVNAFFKRQVAKAKQQGDDTTQPPVGQGTFTTLSLIGLGLTTESTFAAASKGFPVSSTQDVVNYVYNGLGFPKYLGETISGLAKSGIGKSLGTKLGLPQTAVKNLGGFTDAGWFKGIGSAYYGAGAFGNFLQAGDDFHNSDKVAGIADLVEGVGNLLNAAKPLIAEEIGATAGETAGAIGSGLGWLAVLGGLLYQGIKSGEEQQAYANDSANFLQRGLGLNSNLAQDLSLPGQSAQAAAALQAYSTHFNMSRGELLSQLNREPIDKALLFVSEAAGIPTQPGGGYAASRPGDRPGQVGFHNVVITVGDKGPHTSYTESVPNQADSLLQLRYWADYLFGKNQVG